MGVQWCAPEPWLRTTPLCSLLSFSGPRRILRPRSCQWNHCPTMLGGNVSFIPATVLGVGQAAVSGEMGPSPEDFTVCGGPGSKTTGQSDSDISMVCRSECGTVGRHGQVLKSARCRVAVHLRSTASWGPAHELPAASRPRQHLPAPSLEVTSLAVRPACIILQPLEPHHETGAKRHCRSMPLQDHHLG